MPLYVVLTCSTYIGIWHSATMHNSSVNSGTGIVKVCIAIIFNGK